MNSQILSVLIASVVLVVGFGLLLSRGGLIAWCAVLIGLALLAKALLKPSDVDPGLAIGSATLLTLVWAGALFYVISTYESGEVVELAVDTEEGFHNARLWVLDVGVFPVVYFDAEPGVARSLLAGKPLQFTRAGQISTRIPEATEADELSKEQADDVYQAMSNKYGSRMRAADVYYAVLGRPRDRVALIVRLTEA